MCIHLDNVFFFEVGISGFVKCAVTHTGNKLLFCLMCVHDV